MSEPVEGLAALLDLEQIEEDLYRGQSPKTWHQRVFGGQVLGQSLAAAGRTVDPARTVHSLHAYFLRPGDPAVPLLYGVERAREGRSFSTRRVVARQHGRPIFTMSASFQLSEDGLDHQDPMPPAPAPESLPEPSESGSGDPDPWSQYYREWFRFEVRTVPEDDVAPDLGRVGHRQAWLRSVAELPDDPLLHACALAYASDLTLLSASLLPHGRELSDVDLQVASLDHAMWFHRPVRVDRWFLYDQLSPSARGARGLCTGRIFAVDGTLAASVVQEGLIRVRERPD